MLLKKFDSTVLFAYKKHEGQFRQFNNEPYINHCIRVAYNVGTQGGSDDQVRAALLHDVLEDTQCTYEELVDNFGDIVAELVKELTDVYTPEAYPSMNRAERKALEAKRMSTISKEARLIKVCDIMDNTDCVTRGIFQNPGFVMVYLKEKIVVLENLGFK